MAWAWAWAWNVGSPAGHPRASSGGPGRASWGCQSTVSVLKALPGFPTGASKVSRGPWWGRAAAFQTELQQKRQAWFEPELRANMYAGTCGVFCPSKQASLDASSRQSNYFQMYSQWKTPSTASPLSESSKVILNPPSLFKMTFTAGKRN